MPAFLKNEIKKWGQWNRATYPNFSLKTRLNKISWLLKSLRIVLKCYLNPVLNIPSPQEKQHVPLEVKICWTKSSTKTEDFEHFLSPQNVVPSKSCFYLNMSLVFALLAVLFALYYSNLLIYCHYYWYFWYNNWSARNCLKRWRVIYRR